MAIITIINTSASTLNMGMRCLSSNLTSKGHKVNLVFLPFENPFDGERDKEIDEEKETLFNDVLKVCQDSDIIGLSLTTNQFSSSAKLSTFLKEKTGKLIVWGGIHPTLCPEECTEYADVVCLGDGEEILLELIEKIEKGEDHTNIRGTWARKDTKVVKNPIREIKDNLNEYPQMDYKIENKYVISNNTLIPLDYETQRTFFAQTHLTLKDNKQCYTYITQASRGCPHKCTYCSNAHFLKIFKGKGKTLRWRSNKSLMKELKWVKHTYPYINSINFYDDTFFSASEDKIAEFSKAYKKEIGLPFFALASPLTLSESKLVSLIKAGLGHVQMGVQTGSERLNKEVYNRPISSRLTLEKMHLINKYKDKIIPQYDFIMDCPYETDEDKLENLRFISKIPKPFKIQLFSLVLYPHTMLYERAVRDNIFTEGVGGKKKSLAKFSNIDTMDFYSFAVGFSPVIPSLIYKAFTYKTVFSLLNSPRFNVVFKNLVKFAIGLNRRIRITKPIIVNR